MSRLSRLALLAVVGLVLLGPLPALACSVCGGDADSDLVRGARAGIFLLLGVIGAVLTGIAGIGYSWARRARQLQAAEEASEADR